MRQLRQGFRLTLGVLVALLATLVATGSAQAFPPVVETTKFSLDRGVHAFSIAFDANGEVWFVGEHFERNTVVGRVGGDGTVTEYPIEQTARASFRGSITRGPDDAMWFTQPEADAIGRITASGEVSQFELPRGTYPMQIVTGPDGNLWFTQPRGGRIGRMTPSGELTQFQLARRSTPQGIAVGPDGNIWFALTRADKIGRVTPSGDLRLYRLPKTSRPRNIVAGPGGLWFTEGYGGTKGTSRIGRITTEGRIKQFRVPARYGTGAIAAGADGNIWFTTGPYPLSAIQWITPAGELGPRVCLAENCFLPPSSLAFAPDGVLWFGTRIETCGICGGGSAQSLAFEPGMVGHPLGTSGLARRDP
jgi:virginiamycin B lyase